MTDKVQYGLVRLTDEDRKLLQDAIAAVKGVAKGTPAKTKPKAEESADDFGEESSDDTGEESGEESSDDGDGSAEDDFGGGEEESTVTRENVRDALAKLAKATNKANAVKCLKAKGGTDQLSKLAEDKFAAVIAAADAATKKAGKGK